MPKIKIIHIEWSGPYRFDQLSELNDSNRDYGVYQIYGGHPVYGSQVLLYIGKADQQTFYTRISQENWHLNCNAGLLQVHVGRLAGSQTPGLKQWSQEISIAEKLLIYSHAPACNAQFISSFNEDGLHDVHILNWGCYRDLMPEVSGSRWTSKYDDMPTYGIYNLSNSSRLRKKL